MDNVNGLSDQPEDSDINAFLDEEAKNWGSDPNLDDSILDDLEEGEEEEEEGEVTGEDEESEEDDVKDAPKGRPGTDVIMNRLRETDPEAASALLEMQQKMSQTINEGNNLRSDVLAMRQELVEAIATVKANGNPAPEEPAKAARPEMTPENLELFQAMADQLGYVKQETIEAKEIERTSASYVEQSLLKGVEQFGDAFGTIGEDGQVIINPAIAPQLEEQLQRLQDPNVGVTPLDLYRMRYPDAQVRIEGEEKPDKEPTAKRNAAARRRQGTNVARRSTGGGNRIRIYDESRGDSSDDVLNRAFVLAKREMAST